MADWMIWPMLALNAVWAAWNCYAARANHKTALEIGRQLAHLDVLRRARALGVAAVEAPGKVRWCEACGDTVTNECPSGMCALGAAGGVSPCFHRDTVWQQTGDGRPVEFCRDCGRNISVGAPGVQGTPALDQRARFESWAARTLGIGNFDRTQDEEADYLNPDTNDLWRCWQEARADGVAPVEASSMTDERLTQHAKDWGIEPVRAISFARAVLAESARGVTGGRDQTFRDQTPMTGEPPR